ncbi:MAG: ABC transporter ATP-binding protein/permease, partial [Fimbriimonadaceae bacterium]|nr:ABC transporter ATP-binding protein/permease [Alphaproteobacteria bacterium]
MNSNLLSYIWTHTKKQQIWILCIVLLSLPTYFLSLDLPKQIINGPIQGSGFESTSATQPFLRIAFSLFGSPEWVLFGGVELNRVNMLWALSFTFLTLVIVNGLFKFYINTYKGRLGERMLRRLRYTLLDRVLRFPNTQFKRVKSAEISSMVKDEVEPLGNFIGDSFVQPVFLGGQALTAMIFILVQSWTLGLIAVAVIGVQFFIIPRLRRRLIQLNKMRQIAARNLSGRVSEVVEGITAVHVNDTSNYERADMSNQLGKIFFIRYELYQRKFFVKFLNNFLAQMTPFLFYSIGGYFALTGRLDIGQLVAVIAAYKDLPSPIKELIDWDQQRLDVQVKYAQVIEQFSVDDMIDPQMQQIATEPVRPITDNISAVNVGVVDEGGETLIGRVSLNISRDEQIALVGGTNSGAEIMSETFARLQVPINGTIKVGDDPLLELPESITGQRTGYSGGEVFLPQGTVGDNLLYVLKHAPVKPVEHTDGSAAKRSLELDEAKRSGNPLLDVKDDWINYEALGCSGPEDFLPVVKHVLNLADLDNDIFGLGLRGVID